LPFFLRSGPAGETFGLLRQRVLVGPGEEQVGVFVADLEARRDPQAQRLLPGVGRDLLGGGQPVGGLLRFGLVRFLDLGEALCRVGVLLGALLLLPRLLLPEVDRLGRLLLIGAGLLRVRCGRAEVVSVMRSPVAGSPVRCGPGG
jgi:hypothetical protein